MTLTQFRGNKDLMREAHKMRAMTVWEFLKEVLHTEHRNRRSRSVGLSPDDKLVRLGQIEGGDQVLQDLETIFEEPPKPQKEIKSTYE